jgi:hypothetical protein
MFLSQNNGANWKTINTGFPGVPYVLKLGVAGKSVYASVNVASSYQIFVSSDTGSNWTKANTPFTEFNAVFKSGSTIYAGTSANGVYLSTDNGTNWAASNTGLLDMAIKSFTAIGTTVFAACYDDGVYCSVDNGATWNPVLSGERNNEVLSLAATQSTIFAGTRNYVFTSDLFGMLWSPCAKVFPNVWSLAKKDTVIIAGSGDIPGTGGVYCTLNNGSSWWTSSAPFDSAPVYSVAATGSHFFAAMDGYGGMFRSADSGRTWVRVNAGLPSDTGTNDVHVRSVGAFGNAVFAGTQNHGLYVSKDNGNQWASAGLQEKVVAFANFGSNFFAATSGDGIFLSADTAKTWAAVNSGLAHKSINALACYNTTIFAGTNGGGVFLSSNTGAGWNAANSGLTSDTVLSLAVKGDTLYAGTKSSGVWRLPILHITEARQSRNGLAGPSTVVLDICKRTSRGFTVTFSLVRPEHVSINIYNLSGNRIAMCVNSVHGAGAHSFAVDARNFASGYYALRMRTESNETVKRIIFTR